MASIQVDIGSIIEQIRESIVVIRDEHKAQKEKEEQSRLVVYYALSIHPALEWMHPPSKEMGDLDWYQELRKEKALSWSLFGNVGKNEHFKRLALLGETGTRARIMLLLLWVIGHRLPKDKIGQLLSTAVGDALSRDRVGTSLDHVQELGSVNKAMKELVRMIQTKLPLPPQRNPFYGDDYEPADEGKSLPRDELWAYQLPAENYYEFDVQTNPSVLLRRHEQRVLIPQTKLSLLAIQWCTKNFGLGKKVLGTSEVDLTQFWNADPPLEPTSSSAPLPSSY
ncbi:hypothetical protein SISNIDRAFT_460971 [Sistotremastrum niveocremeum HHB9708]|uniref:Uncharacterized protein n=1 Tax=Sistotremastrum niveocremeum HHB9708 TaxID=1314777 RepID=A0A164N4X8_9AGAM|nr:hypothetical protein SISNIDRAFT_460971 [Sistotremastrum niveocremeum HHB9708]